MRFLRCCLLSVCLAILVLAQSTPFCLAGVPPVELPGQTIFLVDPPGIPTLLSPPDGAETTGVTDPPVGVPPLRWSAVVGATKYHVQVSASSGFATLVEETDTYATTYTPLKALADGEYFWRVKAYAGSTFGDYPTAFSFTKTWIEDGAHGVQILQPAEGTAFAAFPDGGFVWTPVTGTATYLLEIGTDDTFASIVYSARTIKPQHTPTRRLANNTYYWRVTPLDHQGHRGLSSEPVRSFTFDWDLEPTLLSPAADSEVAFVPRFSWTAVEAAKEYRLEISSQPDFDPLVAYLTRNTDYTPIQALANDQDYYWRVRATDYEGHNGPWSEVRGFRTAWHFVPQLLSPANNSIHLSYPFFSWTPIPGVERYQIQIDVSNRFSPPAIADEKVYNVTTYAQPKWSIGQVNQDYYWRVRGVDAQDNYTPWSETRSFRTSDETSPNPIYPPYDHSPDETLLPVHSERAIAWPVFVWDTAHRFDPITKLVFPPDYYELTVDDDPTFISPDFQIQTAGLGAAPTLSDPFSGLQDGRVYFWRVRAYSGLVQLGSDAIWKMRYDSRVPELPFSQTLTPTLIYPRDGFEAVATPPVLGWQPVTGAHHYRVQISRGPVFSDTEIADEAQPQFVNYVPWQGMLQPMPFGTYWWRVRAENASSAPFGDWSVPRHFNLSAEVLTGNPYDFVPPPSIITSPLTSIVSQNPLPEAGAYGLGALHVMLDRTYTGDLNWVIAFQSAAASADLRYGLYFDTDHVAASGATADPLGKPITVAALYLPDFVLYINRSIAEGFGAANAFFFRWNGASWDAPQSLAAMGGQITYDDVHQAVQVLIPYTALGSADVDSSGSVALTVFSSSITDPGDGMRDSTPRQGTTIAQPALVSDMLMPLYPFDTPLSDPLVHYDLPPMRWSMPTVEPLDGYQVEVARDIRFTDLVEKWETYETGTWSFFALMPATCQPTGAYADNESYYWHVRIRHERYVVDQRFYDYGPWSSAMRFKLDSREISTTTLRPQGVVTMTPTLEWPRVEGASGYTLQVDNDPNFSSPLVNVNTDATSYTPPETAASQAFPNGAYYWRVAMRRSDRVMGRWTPTLSFEKKSAEPEPLYPLTVQVVTLRSLPTFSWSALLTPTVQPRLAAPRYRLQVASDLNFSSPRNHTTDGASYTLLAGQSLADGTWYWRVAMLDANGNVGTFSDAQSFYKEYLTPTLLFPAQGTAVTSIPVFSWQPLDGAAYYRIEIADNVTFNKPIVGITDNARYTPVKAMPAGDYHWRVQMYDDDDIPGSRFATGRITVGSKAYLPICIR